MGWLLATIPKEEHCNFPMNLAPQFLDFRWHLPTPRLRKQNTVKLNYYDHEYIPPRGTDLDKLHHMVKTMQSNTVS